MGSLAFLGVVGLLAAGYFWVWPWFVALEFAALFAIFAVGTLWFWLLIIGETCLLFYCSDCFDDLDDDIPAGLATVSIIATLLLLQFLGNLNWLGSVFSWRSLFWISGYLVCGILYAAWRWYRFVVKAGEAFKEAKAEFLKNNNRKCEDLENDAKLRTDLYKHVASFWRSPAKLIESDGRILVRRHKARVMSWMMYWPWSGLWYLIHDFVKEVFEHVYRLVHDIFQRISDYALRDIKKDFRQ